MIHPINRIRKVSSNGHKGGEEVVYVRKGKDVKITYEKDLLV